ncbi:MAG: GGDEF domain-containing protein [Comamonadaceae bacterium]|nr:GGDEF domain-containing protein [Comamonadaceae bacterium]
MTLALVGTRSTRVRASWRPTAGDAAPMAGLLHAPDTAAVLENLYGGSASPVLGAYEHGTHAALFALGRRPPAIASVALLPLMRHGALIGSLNLGSGEARRFAADSATDSPGAPGRDRRGLPRQRAEPRALEAGGAHPRSPSPTSATGATSNAAAWRKSPTPIRHALSLPSCMFLDIDRFKRINDTLQGIWRATKCCVKVASRIKSELRGSGILARYGGEEFVVLLPHTAIRHAGEIAERIRGAVAARPFEASPGEELAVTLSIGIAWRCPSPSPEKDNSVLAGNLVAAADKALYHAKQTGRNRVVSELVPSSRPAPLEIGAPPRHARVVSTGTAGPASRYSTCAGRSASFSPRRSAVSGPQGAAGTFLAADVPLDPQVVPPTAPSA